MYTKISEYELRFYLENLKKTMTDGRNFPPSHIYFLNTMSFYTHFKNCSCGEQTVGEVLRQMQHCIPLALTQNSLQKFIDAHQSPITSKFTDGYMEHCKADFLLLIYHSTKKTDQWQALFHLCNSLRLQGDKD